MKSTVSVYYSHESVGDMLGICIFLRQEMMRDSNIQVGKIRTLKHEPQ